MIFTLLHCQNQNAANPQAKNPDAKTSDTEVGSPDLETSKEGNKPYAEQKNIIYFEEGENKFLQKYEMNVTFKKMIEDSRCPKDIQCIWAGNATAEIELMSIYTRPFLIRLSTTNDVDKGWSTIEEFNGYSISLIEVTPETTSAKGFKSIQGNYRVAIKFEKTSK